MATCNTVSGIQDTIFNKANCQNSFTSCTHTCKNGGFCFADCQGSASCTITFQNNNPTLPSTPFYCDSLYLYSYVNCLGSTTTCTTITFDNTQYTRLACGYKCSSIIIKNIVSTKVRISASSPYYDYSLYPFVDCSNANTCAFTITDTDDFYIDCSNMAVKCSGTVSATSVLTYSEFDPVTLSSQYQYIICTNTPTCSFTFTKVNPIYMNCAGTTTCSAQFTTPSTTLQTSTINSYKIYPFVDCSSASGSCTTTVVTSALGIKILCSNTATSTTICKNTLPSVTEFYIDCGV